MSSGGLHPRRDDTGPVATEELTDSNPHHQRVGPRWVRGEIVQAMPCGVIHIDAAEQKWAKEHVVVYRIDGGPDGRPERVPNPYGIYDSRPGDPNHDPVWRYPYVIVPREYQPNTLRSQEDVLQSGYEVIRADMYTL